MEPLQGSHLRRAWAAYYHGIPLSPGYLRSCDTYSYAGLDGRAMMLWFRVWVCKYGRIRRFLSNIPLDILLAHGFQTVLDILN